MTINNADKNITNYSKRTEINLVSNENSEMISLDKTSDHKVKINFLYFISLSKITHFETSELNQKELDQNDEKIDAQLEKFEIL